VHSARFELLHSILSRRGSGSNSWCDDVSDECSVACRSGGSLVA
jgi:hypothetical protein